jgi:N-glycosylase/DNA lyase
MTPRYSRVGDLVSGYNKIKKDIKSRIAEFRRVSESPDDEIFGELCFCLMTANANALKCDEALRALKDGGHHLASPVGSIRSRIKGRVRFHNKKAEFIVGARKLFKKGRGLDLKSRIAPDDVTATRDWLVDNIKGMGYKEASHFLRNIGLGADIAILDRHILKNLKRHGVIKAIPDSVGSRKVYMEIEDKMRRFSKAVGIPLDELDLLFWSLQTGFIFK